jgi:hypothetical protein
MDGLSRDEGSGQIGRIQHLDAGHDVSIGEWLLISAEK